MTDCIICNKPVIIPVTNNVFKCHSGHSCLTCFRDYLGLNQTIIPGKTYFAKCPKCSKLHNVPCMNSSSYAIDMNLIKRLDSLGIVNCPRCSNSCSNQSALHLHLRSSCPGRTIFCDKCNKSHKASYSCLTPIVFATPVSSDSAHIALTSACPSINPSKLKSVKMNTRRPAEPKYEDLGCKVVSCIDCHKTIPEYCAWEITSGKEVIWKCHKCHNF